ncbi:MAG: molecular chaperone TorD family protein [Aestuariibacter sp.]|nr:molecular chaperone TorD family protein [Aestuariibacter sp.]
MTSVTSVVSIEQEQRYRASAYALLAALLRTPPDQAMLEYLTGLSDGGEPDGDELLLAMSGLALSAIHHSTVAIDEEFHDLFIGLGKGEVAPYASWYLTGYLMEQPLSNLRTDLARLGFARSEDITEPEDHAAALCEVVAIMIGDAVDLAVQREFFQSHMADWLERFFEDLDRADSAVFYKSVACFGVAFVRLEKQYFSMHS